MTSVSILSIEISDRFDICSIKIVLYYITHYDKISIFSKYRC